MKKLLAFLFVFSLLLSGALYAQEDDEENGEEKKDSSLTSHIPGIKWRSIGPAFCSGRIADFAVNPENHSEYYVAVASGNIWKTTDGGVTFKPIFDNYGAYSIGCLAIDPNNPYVVWTGTGENNHQRALGYGDGVYKSTDGGASWKNMGLKDSRQIGEIIIDPRNSNIVFVAAEGSAWGPGGDRGLYKTTDGGETWNKVLEISEHTGVNNVIFDPRDPDVMYCTSEQRRRHVFTKIGGGPESAVYKSTDGGENWFKIMKGLPGVDKGGMDIGCAPANPDIIYLVMEAAEDKGGFFRSTNRGASWEKRSDYNASGQYFNELYIDPNNENKVFVMDVVSRYTLDGGKTWHRMNHSNRHVDDHAMWIDPDDSDHYLIGGDGGVYETWDDNAHWDFKENIPVTQFYRVNVDNDTPFYNVMGGTQDNNSMVGPSQTLSSDGIVNDDWIVTNGGDGFWTAADPTDPNIIYAEYQYGGMVRYDKRSGESIYIRPEPGKDELTYKWNWDTPLIISPHSHTRLYCAANFVFRSDDRGDSWEKISPDLTAQIDRETWAVMDKFWSVDAVAKNRSTSLWGTLVSFAESKVKENLLYAGSDDGVISVTENAKDWTKYQSFPGVPEYTYVSDLCPSRYDENVVFATFNNHKRDDFTPYVLKSNDKGATWTSIAGDLPDNCPVHSIEQDFVNPDLLFAGTEFGVYFSTDGGTIWSKLSAGIPTIAVKDIALQEREHDIAVATFGRGFYIIDDYSPLRDLANVLNEKEAHIFPIKDALMYHQMRGRYGQGDNYFKSPNPPFGAVFTYYVKEVPKTLKKIRKEKEKELFEKGEKIPQPSNEELRREREEIAPYLVFTIKDAAGNIVRKLTKSASKGVNRIVWDLRYHSLMPLSETDDFNPTKDMNSSTLAIPGSYTVEITMVTRDSVTQLAGPESFTAKLLENTTLPADQYDELIAFQQKSNELQRTIRGSYNYLDELIKRVETLKQAIMGTPEAPHQLLVTAENIAANLNQIRLQFERDSNFPSTEENPPSEVTIFDRYSALAYTHWRSTSNVTEREKDAYNIIAEQMSSIVDDLKRIGTVEVKNLEDELEKYNAPWTPGRVPELKVK